jgi:hypothetical protein
MSRQINFISDGVQTLIPGMMIAKENTWFGVKVQFMAIIGAKKGIALATKDSQKCVIRFLSIKFQERRCISKDGSRQPVNDVNNTKKGINPISNR